MKTSLAIGERGYITGDTKVEDVPANSLVRFHFGPHIWIDVKFDLDFAGRPCVQIRSMSDKVPSMSMTPLSGNTIYVTPGG